jgi:hypothetical protein
MLACIVAIGLLCRCAHAGQQTQSPGKDEASQSSEAVQPALNQLAESRGIPPEDERPVANLTQREKRIAADKARLLKLATELKQEIDKAGSDTLSITVIRKATEIEKLARSLKQEMNQDLKQTP